MSILVAIPKFIYLQYDYLGVYSLANFRVAILSFALVLLAFEATSERIENFRIIPLPLH